MSSFGLGGPPAPSSAPPASVFGRGLGFGGAPAAGAAPAFGQPQTPGGLFGGAAPAPSGVFGAPAASKPFGGGGVFGGAPLAPAAFGAAAPAPGFGQASGARRLDHEWRLLACYLFYSLKSCSPAVCSSWT